MLGKPLTAAATTTTTTTTTTVLINIVLPICRLSTDCNRIIFGRRVFWQLSRDLLPVNWERIIRRTNKAKKQQQQITVKPVVCAFDSMLLFFIHCGKQQHTHIVVRKLLCASSSPLLHCITPRIASSFRCVHLSTSYIYQITSCNPAADQSSSPQYVLITFECNETRPSIVYIYIFIYIHKHKHKAIASFLIYTFQPNLRVASCYIIAQNIF